MPQVVGTITAAGDFPVSHSKDLKGGLQSVATAAERDAITVAHRLAGMLCYVVETQKYYSLGIDLTTWSEFSGGLASPIELYSWQCAENIEAYQLVFVENNAVIIADATNLDGSNMVIGAALQSKAAGEVVEVVTRGLIVNPVWNWQVKSLFLGSNGQFSTALPTPPCLLWKVAQVTSPTGIFINPQTPVTNRDYIYGNN